MVAERKTSRQIYDESVKIRRQIDDGRPRLVVRRAQRAFSLRRMFDRGRLQDGCQWNLAAISRLLATRFIMQIGKLPDGTYGWAVAAAGLNVADGFI